jgi:hypothetical protein
MENHLYIFLNITVEKTNNLERKKNWHFKEIFFFLLLLKHHFQLVEKKRNQLKEMGEMNPFKELDNSCLNSES